VRPSILAAILGSALVAFSLCGSTWRPSRNDRPASAEEIALYKEARRLYDVGDYTRAGPAFRAAALRAERDGSPRQAAMNWNNVGAAALGRLDFRDALQNFLKAKRISETYELRQPLAVALNNLAGLYLQMGDPEATLRIAREGLSADIRSNPADDKTGRSSRLRYQLAIALARLHRFPEAEPVYRRAIEDMGEQNDFDLTARVLGSFGNDCLDAGRLDEAENALSEALLLVRLHHLVGSANILSGLAKVKALRGDLHSAAALFDEAIESPPGITPRWQIFTDRGQFRLGLSDLRGALADFREARRTASPMREDIVPADQDRVTLESGLTRIAAGLVAAGNRLAQQTSDAALLRETFDAAEQDRLWSLRALLPVANDWRTRLPKTYWDLLARYQAVERTLLVNRSSELAVKASGLQAELQQIQAAAANEARAGTNSEAASTHLSRVLEPDSVLLSFYITQYGGWLWAVDRHGVDVYPVPSVEILKPAVTDFARAARNGDADAVERGRGLYKLLFGGVPSRYLAHGRWLLELDGPLFELPFGALVVGNADRKGKNEPIFLFERKVLQAIPGALMLESRRAFGSGPFLGVGDPVYSPADTRYRGSRSRHDVVLPRLPATAVELEACSRAWNPAKAQLLTGSNAGLQTVRAAFHSNPSVIHFATHIVTAPGDHSSGLIALSLDKTGAMGLIGPAEIAAYALTPSLVVLNGCHSAQGAALPGAGLMGLTRAWIGAGARSVLATRWDIPDEAGATIMVEFYRTLRNSPERGPAFALQQAQSRFLESRVSGNGPQVWGAYFVLGRE
jgi:CHAT domain-containing protein